jgi:hypothetical protein
MNWCVRLTNLSSSSDAIVAESRFFPQQSFSPRLQSLSPLVSRRGQCERRGQFCCNWRSFINEYLKLKGKKKRSLSYMMTPFHIYIFEGLRPRNVSQAVGLYSGIRRCLQPRRPTRPIRPTESTRRCSCILWS